MGYFLTSEVEDAVVVKPLAIPKTHTPFPQVQKRGRRSYSPTLGRWLSRDPIGDEAFRKLLVANMSLERMQKLSQTATLYDFSGNAAVCLYDSHGLFWGKLGEWAWRLGKWFWEKHVRPSKFPNPDPLSPPGVPDPWFDSPPVEDAHQVYCQLYRQIPHIDQCPPCLECKYRCIIPGPGSLMSWIESHVVGITGSCETPYYRWETVKDE